jgi:hypothetical protein
LSKTARHQPSRKKSGLRWRLLTVGVVVFFVAAGIYFLLGSTREAKQLEQNLNDRFGWAEDYIPPANGVIPFDRLTAFLRVREAVQPNCSDYHKILNGIIGLGDIESDPGLSGEQKASRSIGGLKSMIGLGPKMIAFMDARNSSLQTEEMGLGEYFYIYLAAYGEQLSNVSTTPYAEMEEAYISSRTRNEYVQILNNQLAALVITEADAATQSLITQLRTEIQTLENGDNSSPWPNGPPQSIRESLAPLQRKLSDRYCEGLVSIELLQKNRGFSFEG